MISPAAPEIASSTARSFTYSAQPTRVVFGRGTIQQLAQEVEALGARKALVLCTPDQRRQAEAASAILGDLSGGVFDGAQMHVPIEIARRARAHANEIGADCAVAIGGGSTIGLGKAIALESAIPIVAVPTTYSGSEMTPIFGITDDGLKRTGRCPKVLPKTVIYDPGLSDSLPLALSVVSGINAMAHAAEGLYARDGSPVVSLLAEEGIRAIASGLRNLVKVQAGASGRNDCLYGAWLCGSVLGQVGMALHHKLCHALGGAFNLPHAETHTIVLPHALAYNATAAPHAMSRIASAIGAEDAASGIFDLVKELGAPSALRDIGLRMQDVDVVLEQVMSGPYWNPAPFDAGRVRALLLNAWAGRRPHG
jgi:maleylacetate reductase